MSGKHSKSGGIPVVFHIVLEIALACGLAALLILYIFNPRIEYVQSEPEVIIAERSVIEKTVYEFSSDKSIKYLEITDGCFRPADPLTHGEMAKMIYALLGTDKVGTATFSDLSEEDDCYKAAVTLKTLGIISGARFHKDEPVTYDELKEVLSCFSQETDGGEDDVTRYNAVEIMSEILGRQPVLAFSDVGTIIDVSKDDKAFYLIADAALDETLPVMESGYFTRGNELRCIDENGNVVANTEREGFTFDANGIYTSKNKELDEVLQKVIEETLVDTIDYRFHDADGNLRLNDEYALKLLYSYVIDNSKYVPRNYYDMGDTSWAEEEAYVMLTTGRGNCYNYASAFYELARAIGYPAELFSGTMGEDNDPHAWVEIVMDGERKLFDPEVESIQNEWDFESYFKRDAYFEDKYDYKKE